jgi:tetratricopeptide (TPR) repeat protein
MDFTDNFKEAQNLRNQGKSELAYQRYLTISKVGGITPAKRAEALHMAAVSIKEARGYTKSTECFQKAKEAYQSLENNFNLARVTRDFADQLFDQAQYSEANKEFKLSEEVLQNLNNSSDQSSDLGELAMTQVKYALSLEYTNELDSLEKVDQKLDLAIQNVRKSTNLFYLSTAYFLAAKIFKKRAHYTIAIDYLTSAYGTINLTEEPFTKKRAEILIELSLMFERIDNSKISKVIKKSAEVYLNELDEETRKKLEAQD